ncbi:hypothetical protein [Ekhidna sp.]|uniref:transporter n=1 Tax=Ekhidna sp. TaxID=2608089 RepID=UPI003297050A
MIRISFILLMLLISQSVLSQNCCSGGVPISSNIGVAPASKNTWQTILIGDVNFLDQLLRGPNKINNDSRERTTASTLLLLNYSFSNRISADLTMPWVSQIRKTEGANNAIFKENSSGIGDISILLKYQLTDPQLTASSFSLGAGIKVPSGSTDQQDSDGITLSLDMQPGTGSIDQFYWFFYSNQFSNKTSLFLSALFQQTGTFTNYNGSQEYKTGNSLVARLGLNRNFIVANYITTLSMEFIPRKNWADHVDNQLIPNTGGHWLFIKPALTFNFSPSVLLNLGAELPLYANVDGEQLSSSKRLTIQLIHRVNTKSPLNSEL